MDSTPSYLFISPFLYISPALSSPHIHSSLPLFPSFPLYIPVFLLFHEDYWPYKSHLAKRLCCLIIVHGASDAALINFDGFRWSGLMFTTFKLLVSVLVLSELESIICHQDRYLVSLFFGNSLPGC